MPVKGLHENFLLAASLVMGRNGTPINLIDRAEIQANDPLRGLQPEDYARFFTPRLIDHPKLWSLLSANMLFRAFMGDVDHNPEAYVLACDGEGNVAPYICDAGLCAHYLNNRGWDFPQSMFIWKPMWAITNDFFKATQISFDREIISEILNNIYNLPSRRINEIVGAVVASAPQFTIDGKDQTIDTVCAKFESSRQTLSDYFMGYVMKNNIRLLQGKLLPAMPPPGTKRQARRPRVPSQRLDKPLKA
jgi:hypothetical protein